MVGLDLKTILDTFFRIQIKLPVGTGLYKCSIVYCVNFNVLT